MLDLGAAPGELDLGFAGLGSAPAGTLQQANISLSVTVNGVDVTSLSTLLGVKCSFGWDKPVSEASIQLTSKPDSIAYGDTVVVSAGRANPAVTRFTGIARSWDLSNWPKSVTLLARSELSKLEDVIPRAADINVDPDEGQPGIDLDALVGVAGGATLRTIVTAVLTYAAVTLPTFTYDPAHIFGNPNNDPMDYSGNFTWRVKETAMAYLHRLFEATAGARLFSSGDGQHYVAQIVGRPRGDPDIALVEGMDILVGATGSRSITETRNAVRVYGADLGDGDGPLTAEVVSANDYQGGANPDFWHIVSSDLIENEAYATDIANFWSEETNREFVHARIPTWRDEQQGPAQSHLVVCPRIGVNGEGLWVLNSELEVTHNSFTITNSYVGGGLPDEGDPVPI